MRRVNIPVEDGQSQSQSHSISSRGATTTPIPINALTSFNRRPAHDHAIQPHPNAHNDRNRLSLGPRSLPHHPGESGHLQEQPWRLFEERVRTGPYGLTGFPSQPQSPHMVNPRLQQFVRDSPPRVRGQWLTGEEEDELSEEEFKTAMSKLRQHIFRHPRRRAWPRGLFNRNSANSTSHVDVNKDVDEGRECTICLDAFKPNQQVLLTPCNHMFHEECLAPWVKSQGKCPICRHAFVERRPNALSANHVHHFNATNDGVVDIISLIRAMEEAFQWVNHIH